MQQHSDQYNIAPNPHVGRVAVAFKAKELSVCCLCVDYGCMCSAAGFSSLACGCAGVFGMAGSLLLHAPLKDRIHEQTGMWLNEYEIYGHLVMFYQLQMS